MSTDAGGGHGRRLDWLLPAWLEDADAYDQSINEDMMTVYYTVAVNVIVLVFCVMFFSIYRRYDDKIYAPKADLMPERTPPKIPNNTTFGWIYDVYSIDDNVLIDKGGYDVLFFIRFYRISFKIFLCFAIYAWGVLLPINGTGNAATDDNSFELWSMTNIKQGSSRCWYHLIGIYILTGITIYFLEKEFVVYAKHRHIYLRQRRAHLRTVLVEGIPHKMRSTVTLATYFEALYPNSVLSVRLGQDLRYLDRLVARREEAVAKLERCLYAQHHKQPRPTVRLPNMLERVDAIRYYSQILEDLNDAISKEQEKARRLANHADRAEGGAAIDVIEGFLHVTEIGSLKRLLRGRNGGVDKWSLRSNSFKSQSALSSSSSGNIAAAAAALGEKTMAITPADTTQGQVQDSGAAETGLASALARPLNPSDLAAASSEDSTIAAISATSKGHQLSYSAVDISSSKAAAAAAAAAASSSSKSELYRMTGRDFVSPPPLRGSARTAAAAGKSFLVYKLTWAEWLWALWTAPSPSDCWRRLKEGRNAEDHEHFSAQRDLDGGNGWERGERGSRGYAAGEATALISPPEERRMFLSKAFVTFKTFTAATTARQVVHMQLAGHMAVTEAPEPSDMTWINLYSTRTGTLMRRFIVESAVILLIIVWVAPVTLISFVVSEEALRRYSPFIDYWCEHSELFLSAVELVQPGALVAIMNLLPPILTALALLEGCVSFSSNQFRSFDRYFTFQVINVFLVTTIAGSVIDCVKEIYQDPSSAFELLGTSLPKMGGYFTNYLIMKAFIGLGMEIMRIPAMCSAAVKYVFTSNVTPRERRAQPLFGSVRAMSNPGWFPFSKIYAQDVLLVVLCASYACIAPLLLAGGLCYFAGASFVYKHQMLYVYEPIYETGGRWWPKIARCFIVALLFAQASMVGMLVLKETYTQVYFLAILILITSFYYWTAASTYEPLARQLPFDMAVSMDLDQQNSASPCEEELAGHEDYSQPSLRTGFVMPDVEFKLDKDVNPTDL